MSFDQFWCVYNVSATAQLKYTGQYKECVGNMQNRHLNSLEKIMNQLLQGKCFT